MKKEKLHEKEITEIVKRSISKFSTKKSLQNGNIKNLFIFRYVNDYSDSIDKIEDEYLSNRIKLFTLSVNYCGKQIKFDIDEIMDIREQLIIAILKKCEKQTTFNKKLQNYLFLVEIGAETDKRVKRFYNNNWCEIMDYLIVYKFDFNYNKIYNQMIKFHKN